MTRVPNGLIVLYTIVAGSALVWFVRATPTPPSAPPATPAAPVTQVSPPPHILREKWSGGDTAASKMDDSPTVAYALEAESTISVWLKEVRPTLFLRCREHRTDAFMQTASAAAVEYGDTRTVRVRWDERPSDAQGWIPSNDNEALFAPNPVGFIRTLARAKRLRIQFTPFNAPSVVVEFDVSGFGTPRLEHLAHTCGWKPSSS